MSGVQNFFGNGYPFHKLYERWLLNFDFTDMIFVAKTTTLEARKGNLDLNQVLQPTELIPRSIYYDFRRGIMLNAVGLSGPGATYLLGLGKWQKRTEPFWLSFMSVEKSLSERLGELRKFVVLLKKHLPDFQSAIGLQINFSCPNVSLHGRSYDELIEEIRASLEIATELEIPIMPKLAVTFPARLVKEFVNHECFAGICISNTIPWRTPGLGIDWDGLFGPSKKSPLQRKTWLRRHPIDQPGGLSGKPLLPLVLAWVREARANGFDGYLNVGGGILHPRDIDRIKDVGGSSVALGSIALLRPWRVQPCIARSHQIF